MDFPSIKIVKTEIPENVSFESNIIYKKIGNRKLHIDLFSPTDKKNDRNPAVVLIHGGGWKSGDKSMMNPMAAQIAAKGYVTVTVEYRLSPEAKYPAAIYDLKSCIIWLKENAEKYNIDTNKITVLGCSAGGTLAALLGATNDVKKFEPANKNHE